MVEKTKLARLVLSLLVVAALTVSCAPKTLTEVITEEDFKQDAFLCQDNGLEVDFQPGKIVCTGELEGQQVSAEITAELTGGGALLKIVRFTANGTDLAAGDYAHFNAELAKAPLVSPEGYAITSITITDKDITIVRTRQ